MRITFYEIDGFIRVYDRTRYLVLFGAKNIIKLDIIVNSSITNVISHNYGKIKIYSCDSLPVNVITLIKSVIHKDRNNYYYNIFLEIFIQIM